MNQLDFHKLWRKYGNLVLGGLFLLFIVSYCNQQARYAVQRKALKEQQVATEGQQQMDKNSPKLKTFEELMRERQQQEQEEPDGLFTMLLLLSIGVGIVWLTRQPWWLSILHKWFPGQVQLRVFKGKDKITGKNLLKVTIENKTRDALTFLPPMVVFKKWGKERRFRLKGSDQEDMFPLTLTPGTGHRILLDMNQFFEKIPDLKKSNRVGAMVETSEGKTYKKFVWPRWINLFFN